MDNQQPDNSPSPDADCSSADDRYEYDPLDDLIVSAIRRETTMSDSGQVNECCGDTVGHRRDCPKVAAQTLSTRSLTKIFATASRAISGKVNRLTVLLLWREGKIDVVAACTRLNVEPSESFLKYALEAEIEDAT